MTLPQILLRKICSPSGENSLISLRIIRKTMFFGGRVMTRPYRGYPAWGRQSAQPDIHPAVFAFCNNNFTAVTIENKMSLWYNKPDYTPGGVYVEFY